MPLWVLFFVLLTVSSGSHCSLPPSTPVRMQRYADAIFTNSYRKVLGQLSARQLLQDILSRQQGDRHQEPGARGRLGRQAEQKWAEQKRAEQKRAAPESVPTALPQHRWGSPCVSGAPETPFSTAARKRQGLLPLRPAKGGRGPS
ncbi:somatoliberin [Oryctolagus cuniculus]|uniref:somatoliberin n=1 Tax=Oryctolagus cuniculus TaxID=9986 RepID=UPI0038790EF7